MSKFSFVYCNVLGTASLVIKNRVLQTTSLSYPSFIGQHVIYKAHCASTNTWALKLLQKQTVPAGTVVITDHQSQGRGQQGQHWYSEPGKNLTFSIVLYPTFLAATQTFSLNIVTTLALYQVLSTYIPHALAIKWPNDIYYQDKKLSGLLIENRVVQGHIKSSVVGIGLNVNQINFEIAGATSLQQVCGQYFDLQLVLQELLTAMTSYYHQLQCGKNLQSAYLAKLYWLNDVHIFQDAHGRFKGIIRDVDVAGRLIVEHVSGLRRCYATKELVFIA